MQADWEFEVGGDAPVIDALWLGFVDLRAARERVRELPETSQCVGLATALEKLNSPRSPVWTCKCDFWPELDAGEFDGDELDSPAGECSSATAVYIDMLPAANGAWRLPQLAEAAARELYARLAAVPLRCCRADLIIRRAVVALDATDFGITAYLTACGAGAEDAARTLEAVLAEFGNSFFTGSTLQWKSAGE